MLHELEELSEGHLLSEAACLENEVGLGASEGVQQRKNQQDKDHAELCCVVDLEVVVAAECQL